MILYFADREMNILGQASTSLPGGSTIEEDNKVEDVETGVATFSCRIAFTDKTRAKLEEMTNAGNYLLRSHEGENEFYTIIESEVDTKNRDIYIYAEDAGLDLINEIVGDFEADGSYNAEWYVNKYIADSGFEIGINEIPASTKRKLTWEGEATVTARLASIATQFGGFEVSYSFEVKGLSITKKYINIYEKRGKDEGVQLRLGRDIDRIVTNKSVANLATALVCEGGIPDDASDTTPMTFAALGYSYDDGDFFIDGNVLKSRNARNKWVRFLKPNEQINAARGYIEKPYSYDTTDPETLKNHAITELKKICDMEINYEVDIKKLPEGVKIGDRVNIVDDAGGLYVSTRVLLLETSVIEKKFKATLGEHIIKTSGISQKVEELASAFAKNSQSAARALEVAKNALDNVTEAHEKATAAAESAASANASADEAKSAAQEAEASATTATERAQAATDAVGGVVSSIESLTATVDNAQQAAANAYIAAETAQSKADEAATAAANARTEAAEADEKAEAAKASANEAKASATEATTAANEAKTNAQSAIDTAEAAKLDAEQAKTDLEEFADNLPSRVETLTADFARKTELTETEAHLQAQITENANGYSEIHSKVVIIDETANDAKENAEAAQSAAAEAQAQATQAAEEAAEAQSKADEASTAAANAQSEADKANAAAASAKSVADKANDDLETAKADLATVTGRVDATEDEIAAAQAAVNTAQAAADKANEDAAAAAAKAVAAQTAANNAATEASEAQTAANNAATAAANAQATANDAKGDASAAQSKANEAASAATAAQNTANQAVTNAQNAQAKANEAAADAAAADQAAKAADAKAAQAQTDLNTAKQNLANTIARVDATEEEVEAAQAAVDAAQAAANTAAANAAAAQNTADAAKANAATAQEKANEAKTAADNAQKDADDAKAIADTAKAAADALVVRVSSCETEISKSNEQIALRATKTEVDSIQVGGKNLYTKSSDFAGDKWVNLGLWAQDAARDSLNNVIMYKNGQWGGIHQRIAASAGDVFTLSATVFAANCYVHFYVSEYNASGTEIHGAQVKTYAPENLSSSGTRIFATHTVKNNCNLSFRIENSTAGATIKISSLKLEKGSKATDWTYAPEDLLEGIYAADSKAQDAIKSITEAEAQITILADQISNLVRNGTNGSLLKQDAAGLWYFDISSIEDNISNSNAEAEELAGIVKNANGEIDVLKSTAEALAKRTEYVRSFVDENGQPCLELGEGDSKFKVRITNTDIQFEDDGAVPAKINRKMLVIEKTMIKNELQFGDDEDSTVSGVWIWKRRANGNLGLSWKGVSN